MATSASEIIKKLQNDSLTMNEITDLRTKFVEAVRSRQKPELFSGKWFIKMFKRACLLLLLYKISKRI